MLSETPKIMKTCRCNVNPLTPHFYIVKLGFTRIIFFYLFYALKQRSWVLVRTALRRSQRVPTINVLSKIIRNISQFLIRNFHFYSQEILLVLHGHVFVMRPVFSQRGSYNYVHCIFFYNADVLDLYHKLLPEQRCCFQCIP